jgi:hypothetical protein
VRQHLTRESIGIILRASVKHFFIKEVAPTLMMDALYALFKVLKRQGMQKQRGAWNQPWPDTPMVIKGDMRAFMMRDRMGMGDVYAFVIKEDTPLITPVSFTCIIGDARLTFITEADASQI